MDISKQYEQLAAQLGDIVYKLTLYEAMKADVLEKIKKLDELAGMLNAKGTADGQANEPAPEKLSD